MTYKTTEYFALTNETIERDATPDEIAVIEQLQANEAAVNLAKQERAAQKAALLTQLGITEEQAKLLLS